MKILVSGSSGLIGSRLLARIKAQGHQPIRLLRASNNELNGGSIIWDPYIPKYHKQDFEGLDAVVNLAGDNIASGRWTEEKKKQIEESRVQTTTALSKCLSELRVPPKVMISASAVGYYGSQRDDVVIEESASGTGFLAKVCREWEAASDLAEAKGIRVVKLRIGGVLSSEGGLLKKMIIPFKLGLGGIIGSGKQYMSWIDIEDVVSIILYAIQNESFQGPVNAVSPEPVTNEKFTKTLGKILHRPTFLNVPAFVARLVLGEMADELLLSSVRAAPQRLLDAGFSFQYPNLESALKHELTPTCDKSFIARR